MRADGLSDAAVAAFKNAYDALTSGARSAALIEGRSERFGRRHHWLAGNHRPLPPRRALDRASRTPHDRALQAPRA